MAKEIRKKGRVKWFDAGKGYGFIEVEGERGDVFVHYSEIREDGYRKLEEGDEVEFAVVPSERREGKFQAVDVVRLEAV